MNAKQLRIECLEQRALLAVTPLVTETTVAKAFVPTTQDAFDDLGLDWVSANAGFDDSTWSSTPAGGPNGVGFPDGPGAKYDDFVGLNLQPMMQGVSSTALVRIPFAASNVANIEALTLKLRLDDGFIAWLNGVEIARSNAPAGYPAWSARSTAAGEATATFTTFDVSGHTNLLVSGTNLLAIRGFNALAAQADFLIQAALDAEIPDAPPIANNDTASVEQGATTVIDVLANDTAGTLPIDPRTVQVVDQPDHGTVIVHPTTGAITYMPAVGFRGTDTLTYRVRDTSSVPTPGEATQDVTVVSTTAMHHRRIPTVVDAAIGTTWTGGNEPFNTANWTVASGGIGYDNSPAGVDFAPFIGDDVGGQMFGVNGSAYMRVPFTVTDPSGVTGFRLRMRVDDGFIAYINGIQVASIRAPVAPTWNSLSTAGVPTDADAIVQQEYLIPISGINLRSGASANILAIHGLNTSIDSSDFLIQPELIAEVVTTGRWSNEATVTVNVVGTGPMAVDDTASTTGTTPVEVSVMANDLEAEPPNNYPLRAESIKIVRPPANGTATVDTAEGLIVYQANPGFSGVDTLEYTIRDAAPIGGTQTEIILPRTSPEWRYLDTGVDPGGTTWRNADFNDAAWLVGAAQLGYGDVQATTTAMGRPTMLFRKFITLTSDDVVELKVRLLRDDGGAVYINGVEIRRDNLPANAAFGDFANGGAVGGADEETYWETILTAADLQMRGVTFNVGENIIAAEVHQDNATSSDIGFDVELEATFSAPTGRESNLATVTISVASTNDPPIANPDSAFTLAGEAVQIDVLANDVARGAPLNVGSVTLVGGPVNGTAVVGASGLVSYTPAVAFLGEDSFTYFVRDADGRVSNTATVSVTVASGIVTLGDDDYFVDEDDVLNVPMQYGVLANDTSTSGAVVSATVVDGPLFGTLTLATNGGFQYTPNANFSGEDQFTYRGADSSGSSAVASVTIRVTPSPDAPLAFGDVYSTTVNTPLVVVAAPPERQYLVSTGATWRYHDEGQVPSTAWRIPEFDDTAWATGPAQLGYGDGDEATVVGFGDDFNNRHITTYFRREFFVPDRSQVHALQLGLLRDDGAIVYLNGTQIANSNMPTGSISATTLALASEAGSEENTFLTFDLNPESLAPGRNILAVRVHQSSATSTDMSFDSFLRGAVAGPVTGGVLANDIDPDGDYMTATLVSPPAHGTLSMTADGGFVYTPSAGFVGADSFTYRASDGTRDSNAATVVLNVAPLGFAAGDLNDDGFVDEADLAIVVHDLGMAGGANRLQGDANGDGFVDLRDVLEVQRAMGAQRPAGAAAGAIVANARNATESAANDAVLAALATRVSLAASRRYRVASSHTTAATLLGTANVDRTFAHWESGGEQASTRTLRASRRR